MSMNIVILLGNVGRDPEIRAMPSGDKVANFSIATSKTWRDKTSGERKEQTEWHNIACFNQGLIRVIEQYVKKGTKVGVRGSLKTREYTDRDGNQRKATEVVLETFGSELTLEGGGQGSSRDESDYGSTRTREDRGTRSQNSGGGGGGNFGGDSRPPLDDDIPF